MNCHQRTFPAIPSSLRRASNSLGSASPELTTAKCLPFPMSGMTAGHHASGRSVNPLLQGSAVSPIPPETPQLASSPSQFFASPDSQGSLLPVQGMDQQSPLLQICQKEFPHFGPTALVQHASIKKNEHSKRKCKNIKYLPSDFQFNNIARQSKF